MSKVEFYKEKEFKKTEIGKIPKEWEVKRLGGEICEINPNYKIQRGKIYKFLPMEAVNEDFYKVKFYTERKWNGSGVKFAYGDVLLARITPSAENGKTALVDFLNRDECGIGSTEFIVFKPKETDSFFIYYILKWDKVRNQLINQMTGTTGRQRIPNSAPNRVKISLPPLSEQKAIAKVLKDFDDLLEVIEEKIKTLQRIKKGLMEVYFTKGVFEHKEFKDTEIGRIPKEWEVRRLGEVVIKLKAGGTPKTSVKEYYQNGYIPFVKIEDLTTNGKYLRKTLLKITEEGLRNSSAWLVPENSLLLAMYGSLGEVSINKIQVATNQAILGIIPNSNKLELEYLYYWLLYFKPKWNLYAKTTTQANLTKQIVENSFIPLPPLPEQKAIAQRLKTIDDQIENLKNQKETLQKIKKKFMDLLLTGKVRVKEIKEGTEA